MIPNIAAVTFDCADAEKLAGFWSALLDRPVTEGASADMAVIDGAPALMFLTVPEPKSVKNRVHLDLVVEDLAAGVERAMTLGATRQGDFDEAGFRWATLTDPEGNEFDIAVHA